MTAQRILVIKLAALGDFAQAFGPFAAIRAHHAAAHITLLTTPPFAALAAQSPWFDTVWENGRPPLHELWRLAAQLRRGAFARVYDLQTSTRSSRYRWAVGRRTEWSGIGLGASHPHANPDRDNMHTVERQREQLQMAGITHFPPPNLAWLDAPLEELQLPEAFAVLVPGAAVSRPGKRWPAERFAALAARLGLPAVIIGGKAEVAAARLIRAAAPATIDLTQRTKFAEIAAIGRRAAVAIGNDTGPMHLLAAAGCPCVSLFGAESDPALCAPRGPAIITLRHLPLAELPVAEVADAVRRLLP